MAMLKEAEDKIRDLINFVQVRSDEETAATAGRKIEPDTAGELKTKLRELAEFVGQVQ